MVGNQRRSVQADGDTVDDEDDDDDDEIDDSENDADDEPDDGDDGVYDIAIRCHDVLMALHRCRAFPHSTNPRIERHASKRAQMMR